MLVNTTPPPAIDGTFIARALHTAAARRHMPMIRRRDAFLTVPLLRMPRRLMQPRFFASCAISRRRRAMPVTALSSAISVAAHAEAVDAVSHDAARAGDDTSRRAPEYFYFPAELSSATRSPPAAGRRHFREKCRPRSFHTCADAIIFCRQVQYLQLPALTLRAIVTR